MESEHICERVVPYFQHVTASVVLGAVKVCCSSTLVAEGTRITCLQVIMIQMRNVSH
ncbi:hypothetical protein BGW80DRAFT_1290968, partial [Lactifluus volemus]